MIQEGGRALVAAGVLSRGKRLRADRVLPVPGTPLWEDIQRGRFHLQDGPALTRELRLMLEHALMPRGLFLANHASNHLPLRLRMPRDREAGLAMLDQAQRGLRPLRPEALRRL